MELAAAPASRPPSWKLTKAFAGTAFAALLALVVVLFLHALLSMEGLVIPAEAAAVVFVLGAAGAAVSGSAYAWRAYPRHRGAMVILAVITAATFAAHAYTLGTPPAYTVKTASGPVGGSFVSGDVNVTSSVTGNYLTVTVTAQAQYSSGNVQCCEIANPVMGNSSGALAGKGFTSPPTLASPLGAADATVGTWYMTKPVSTLNMTYDSLTCYSDAHQEYGCIMDEIYYVPEAMGLLSGQQCSTASNAPSDCHMEHPPLAPALMAAGMAVFGEYNAAAWRLFPALLGTLSVPLIFGIAWRLSGNKKLSLVAAAFLALDVMFFSQSAAGLLDVPQVFFALAGFLAYFAGVRWWKFDRYVVAGILMGLAGLAKETGVFLVMALLSYILLFEKGPRVSRVASALKVVLVVGIVFAAGLQVYDTALAPAVPTFAGQVSYILSYGAGLNSGCPWACGWSNQALGGFINPFEWILYYSPVGYYITTVSTCGGSGCSNYVSIGYYGVTNLLETWTVFAWFPLIAYEVLRHGRRSAGGKPMGEVAPAGSEPLQAAEPDPGAEPEPAPALTDRGDLHLGAFALLFFMWAYLPYIPLFLAGRVTYPFYFVPAIPAAAMGTAWWGTRWYFPRWLLAVYMVMVFGFFLVYYPDKSFLPVWLRVILRH